MANVENNKFYFDRKNYFLRFTSDEQKLDVKIGSDKFNSTVNPINRSIRHALEYFVNDLRHDRDKTIERFLNEQTVNDIFRSLAQLLLSDDDRVCGNSAYILGSAVELEIGLKRFLTIFSNNRTSTNVDVIRALCQLLTHSDSECVLNAAGTLGTICSAKDGRELILHHTCISQMIINTSALLSSTNSWIASNAGLVLARITVEESGCQAILTHSKHREILNQLISALDINDPNRSTNAAFAIGRLIEGDDGKKIFISDCGQYKIFDALLPMLEVNDEKGINKNACYALSCLCTTQFGFQLCLQYLTNFHRILLAIEKILLSVEHETVWFALMCLRTIAQYDGAHEHLCYSKTLPDQLKQIRIKWIKYKDIQDEAKLIWYMIHKHIKPDRPKLDECRTTSADISWNISIHLWENDELQFRIILDNEPIGTTNETNYCLKDLKSSTIYNVQIQYITSYGDSVPSDSLIFHTEDDLPPPVNNLYVVRKTMTAARIAWDQPDLSLCNSFKGYQIYLNNAEYECTNETGITIGSLVASTAYQVDVCIITNKGKSPRATLDFVTAAQGDSNPAPPVFSVVGRREIHVKWQPPDVICGRLTRYELLCNKKCIYSGTDLEYHATLLKSDAEYSMTVIAITNEGRFRSRPAKTRTLKDEFNNSNRHSLYEPIIQTSPKLKRFETNPTLYPSHRKDNISKSDRSLLRESTLFNKSSDHTAIHTLELKSDNSSNNRTLPKIVKDNQNHSTGTLRSRNVIQRSRQNPTSTTQTRITATVVIPTLEIDHRSQVKWATPVTNRTQQSKFFQLAFSQNLTSNINNRKISEHAASTSLPDLPLK